MLTLVLVLGALAVVAVAYETLRTTAIGRWCRRHGFEYLGKVPAERRDRHLPVQDLLGGGRVYNWGAAVSGQGDGQPLLFLEHEWATGSLSAQKRQWFTFVIWSLNDDRLPRFSLSHRTPPALRPMVGFFDALLWIPRRLFGPVGRERAPRAAAIEEDPAFDRRFRVIGDENAVRAILTPDVRAALLDAGLAGRVAGDGRLLLWQTPGLLAPWRLDAILSDAVRLRRLLAG